MISSSEVSRMKKHVRIKKRGEQEISCDERDLLGVRCGLAGPVFLDPITLGDPEMFGGQGVFFDVATTDPLLFCEVDCAPDRDTLGQRHEVSDKECGPQQEVGPLVKPIGEILFADLVMEMDRVVGGEILVEDQVVEAMRINLSENELVTGLLDGPAHKILESAKGLEASLSSKWLGESGLEKIYFSDEKSLPNLTPPLWFNWEFIAEGWALRPSVGLPNIVEGGTSMAPDGLHSPSVVIATSDSNDDSDDSFSEFEMNLKELLPGLQGALSRVLRSLLVPLGKVRERISLHPVSMRTPVSLLNLLDQPRKRGRGATKGKVPLPNPV